ncbi:methyltransferase [Streptomyces mashuensis]|uniref:Methyltransferase n=1 Tax=Streptomyces mashuensis TaxID=33904 RepID=A0A919AZK0_9ACTN|nr:class I SAM-dependent methyltransferase [Streptomyces mashuensis]GHF34304.1 methyltransferase [Streptomyces mashuensis]
MTGQTVTRTTPWNHNVHYHPLILDAVPDGCGRALDLGCGDGLLARRLAERAREVTGVDRSEDMIRQARRAAADAHVPHLTFLQADFLRPPLPEALAEGTFDFVSAVAVVHHGDFATAVQSMKRLLAPGGRLVIVGLARPRTPYDWLTSAAGVPAARWLARRHGGVTDPPGMPVEDPRTTWTEVRRTSRALLPGRRFRRHLLWRYSVVWERPRPLAR